MVAANQIRGWFVEEKEVRIRFTVVGYVEQTVRLSKPMSAEDLQTMLNKGTVFTTIQDGGTVDIVETGEVIGTVVDVTNNCEYEDFEVEDEEE
jgi:hypothetical protein